MPKYECFLIREVSKSMRHFFELSKHELNWLDDKFERYEQLDSEITYRKQRVKERPDEYVRERLKWKKAIEKVYSLSTQDEKTLLEMKFWSDHNHLEWGEVGETFNLTKKRTQEMRYSILKRFALEIGYI